MESSSITSLLAPLSQYYFSNGKRNNSMATVDTALGAAVTLGFSLAVLRLTSHTLRQHNDLKSQDDEKNSENNWFVSFLQAILIRNFFQKKIERDCIDKPINNVGDAYFSTLRNSMELLHDEVEGIYVGSCHCQAIGFTLKVKGSLKALDCTGKIRYPHVLTTASNFQLTKGSNSLNMYYVSLPSEHSASLSPSSSHLKCDVPTISAAHAFCKRCGVHIFRAPDSRTNVLEVNVNCLNLSSTNTGNTMKNLEIAFYESDQKLGGGTAVESQWNQKQKPTDNDGNKQTPFASTPVSKHNETTPLTSSPLQKYYSRVPLSSTETESTAMLSNSSQSFQSERQRSDQESSSMDSSSQGSNPNNPLLYTTTASTQNKISNQFGINSWPGGPSVLSTSRNASTPRAPEKKSENRIQNNDVSSEPIIHTPILQHQLKYYMKRHLKTKNDEERESDD